MYNSSGYDFGVLCLVVLVFQFPPNNKIVCVRVRAHDVRISSSLEGNVCFINNVYKISETNYLLQR